MARSGGRRAEPFVEGRPCEQKYDDGHQSLTWRSLSSRVDHTPEGRRCVTRSAIRSAGRMSTGQGCRSSPSLNRTGVHPGEGRIGSARRRLRAPWRVEGNHLPRPARRAVGSRDDHILPAGSRSCSRAAPPVAHGWGSWQVWRGALAMCSSRGPPTASGCASEPLRSLARTWHRCPGRNEGQAGGRTDRGRRRSWDHRRRPDGRSRLTSWRASSRLRGSRAVSEAGRARQQRGRDVQQAADESRRHRAHVGPQPSRPLPADSSHHHHNQRGHLP